MSNLSDSFDQSWRQFLQVIGRQFHIVVQEQHNGEGTAAKPRLIVFVVASFVGSSIRMVLLTGDGFQVDESLFRSSEAAEEGKSPPPVP